jgi:hypothetical protein
MEMATNFLALVPDVLDEAQGNKDHFELTA